MGGVLVLNQQKNNPQRQNLLGKHSNVIAGGLSNYIGCQKYSSEPVFLGGPCLRLQLSEQSLLRLFTASTRSESN